MQHQKTNLKIKFHQSIDKTSIKTIEQFSIKDSSNNPLKISKVTMDQDTNKILYLETDIQKERENYSITITNLKGLNNEITHENGLITEFTGFIPANEKRFFQIITPNEITVNRTFNVTINAIKGIDNSFVTDYNEEISFEVVGSSGTLTVNTKGFTNGVQELDITYSSSISGEQTENFILKVYQKNDQSINGTSDNIIANAPVAMSHFNIESPATVISKQDFNITITAIGTNLKPFKDYDSTISIETINGNGTFTHSTINSFTDGILVLTCNYTATEDIFQIKIKDNSNYEGKSNSIHVGTGIGDSFLLNFSGIPIDTTKIRLNWNKLDTIDFYNIYRKNSEGDYEFIIELDKDTTSYIDEGLTENTNYEYKIEASTYSLVIISEASLSISTKDCTSLSGSISSDTTWTLADSPYCISSDLNIEANITIEAGVILKFADDVTLTVTNTGSLIAIGNSEKPILFTSSNENPEPGNWKGLRFTVTATGATFDTSNNYLSGSSLNFCVIEYAKTAVKTYTSLDLRYSVIRYNKTTPGFGGSGIAFNYSTYEGTGVIKHCNFYGNIAEAAGCAAYFKDGVAGSPKIIFENNVVDNNTTKGINDGSGLYVDFDSISIKDNIIKNNTCGGSGGGIAIFGSNVTITNNTLQNNYCEKQGGGIYTNDSNTDINNNIITENIAALSGGGIQFGLTSSNMKIDNNVISKNYSPNTGGGIHLINVATSFTNNILSRNTAGADGGGLYISTALNTISNNTFILNEAGVNGGGLYSLFKITIDKCTFNYNKSLSGGAINLNSTNNQITESIFKNNSCFNLGGAIYCYSGNFSKNTITNNQSGNQGGAMVINDNSFIFENTITNNKSSVYGGAIVCVNFNNISNNTINSNTSLSGGAFYIKGINNQVRGNTINNNYASNGGAIHLATVSLNKIDYNILTNNTAINHGGAVYISDNTGDIEALNNNHIYSNIASNTSKNIYNSDTDTTHDCTNNWWGINSSDKDIIGICDGTGSACGVGELLITPVKTSPMTLCSDSGGVAPSCVGVK